MILALAPNFSVAAQPIYSCLIPDKVLGHIYRESCRGEDVLPDGRKVPVLTNSAGLRDREFEIPAKNGVYRALFFAPHMGLPLPDGDSIARQIGKNLEAAKIATKVEVINASAPGYRLVHESLRIEKLLKLYRPKAVIVFHGFQATSLAQAADHLYASDFTADGLAKSVGTIPSSWPLPASLFRPQGPIPLPDFIKYNSSPLALAWLKLKLRLWPAKGEGTFYVQNQLRYLRALKEIAAANGSDLLVVTREYLDEVPEEFFARVKKIEDPIRPDFKTNHWLTWPHTGPEDLAIYKQQLDRDFWVVHAKQLMKQANPPVKFFQNDGMTPTPEGLRAYAARISEALFGRAGSFEQKLPAHRP